MYKILQKLKENITAKEFELVRETTTHRVSKDCPNPILSVLKVLMTLTKFLNLIVFAY